MSSSPEQASAEQRARAKKHRRSIELWLTIAIAAGCIGIVLVVALIFVFRPVVVPKVTTLSVKDATTALTNAGLTIGTTGHVATTTVGSSIVVAQSPAPLSKAPRRTSVNVTITASPTDETVPKVTELDVAVATQQLSALLFLPVQIDVFGTSAKAGAVTGQYPPPEMKWRTGLPVAIEVAAGPDNGTAVKVPDLKGKTMNAASAELQKLGLKIAGFNVDIGTSNTNVATTQYPAGGVLVRPGTKVLLLFEQP
jgi:eukaryotic-like serine/threonine-protein kinase